MNVQFFLVGNTARTNEGVALMEKPFLNLPLPLGQLKQLISHDPNVETGAGREVQSSEDVLKAIEEAAGKSSE